MKGCFLDLVEDAAFKDYVDKKGKFHKQGHCYVSQKRLADRWEVDPKTVHSYLDKWKKAGLIDYQTMGNRQGTDITICNYESMYRLSE